MSRTFLRIVVCLLIPCLAVDSATAAAFPLQQISPAASRGVEFQTQAIPTRLPTTHKILNTEPLIGSLALRHLPGIGGHRRGMTSDIVDPVGGPIAKGRLHARKTDRGPWPSETIRRAKDAQSGDQQRKLTSESPIDRVTLASMDAAIAGDKTAMAWLRRQGYVLFPIGKGELFWDPLEIDDQVQIIAYQVGFSGFQINAWENYGGFPEPVEVALGTGASELADNIQKHAHANSAGAVFVRANSDQTSPAFEIIARDLGVGIKDLDQVMVSGYSTTYTSGRGLNFTRDLAVYKGQGRFTIESKGKRLTYTGPDNPQRDPSDVTQGTLITLKFIAPTRTPLSGGMKEASLLVGLGAVLYALIGITGGVIVCIALYKLWNSQRIQRWLARVPQIRIASTPVPNSSPWNWKEFGNYIFSPWNLQDQPDDLDLNYPRYTRAWNWIIRSGRVGVGSLFILTLLYRPLSLFLLKIHFVIQAPYLVQIATPFLGLVGLCVWLWAWMQHSSGRGGWLNPGKETQNSVLITTGPYRYMRHPMYLFYGLALLGIMKIYPPWSLFVALYSFAGLGDAWRSEDLALWKQFGAKYLGYARRTPLIPFMNLFKTPHTLEKIAERAGTLTPSFSRDEIQREQLAQLYSWIVDYLGIRDGIAFDVGAGPNFQVLQGLLRAGIKNAYVLQDWIASDFLEPRERKRHIAADAFLLPLRAASTRLFVFNESLAWIMIYAVNQNVIPNLVYDGDTQQRRRVYEQVFEEMYRASEPGGYVVIKLGSHAEEIRQEEGPVTEAALKHAGFQIVQSLAYAGYPVMLFAQKPGTPPNRASRKRLRSIAAAA